MAGRDDIPDTQRRVVSIRLAKAGLERVRREARRRGVSLSEVIRLALAIALPRLEAEKAPAPRAEEM